MKTFVFGIVSLLLAPIAVTQHHAPLAAQCQADANLWYNTEKATEYLNAETARIQSGIPNRTEGGRMSLREVLPRITEMGECFEVDPAHSHLYHDAEDYYATIMHDRVTSYVNRHNLMPQIFAEDDAGKR
jgi:hypothetical protein